MIDTFSIFVDLIYHRTGKKVQKSLDGLTGVQGWIGQAGVGWAGPKKSIEILGQLWPNSEPLTFFETGFESPLKSDWK